MKIEGSYDFAAAVCPLHIDTTKPTVVLSASAPVRIPFHDLDPAGFVWHGRYFKYFEQARSSLLESVGYSYREMKQSGILWPVVDTQVRYLKPLTLGQEISVSAELTEWEFRLAFDYRIEDEEGALCTRAKTVQVPIDAQTYELQIGAPDILLSGVSQKLAALRDAGDNV